jgi:hypothetical protein
VSALSKVWHVTPGNAGKSEGPVATGDLKQQAGAVETAQTKDVRSCLLCR